MPCIKPKLNDVLLCSEGDGSLAGIGQYLSLISTNNVTGEPAVAALTETTTNEAYAVATGDFSLLADKYFSRFQMLPESANFNLATVGTVGQLKPDSTFALKLPFNKGAYGALKKIVNDPLVIAYTNGQSELFVVGRIDFPAYVSSVAIKHDMSDSFIEITIKSGPKWPYFSETTLAYAPVV